MLRILILVIALFATGYAVADTGRYLVPVQKQEMLRNKTFTVFSQAETVCVLDDCYYVVDEDTAKKYVSMGVAQFYSPVVKRYLYSQPNDAEYLNKWELRSSRISWEDGWDIIKDLTVDNNTPIAAITDTGFVDHADLPKGSDVNVYGVFQVSQDYLPNTEPGHDYYGHGSHVAGIIGALTDNNIGIASVSGGKARIMSVKVSKTAKLDLTVDTDTEDEGEIIYNTDLMRAIDLILQHKQNANIVAVNMSLGGPQESSEEYDAIKKLMDAGIIVVAAAGNESDNLSLVKSYPASYDLGNIVTVGAVRSDLARASYSNYGGTTNIFAPGGDGTRNGGILSFKVIPYSLTSSDYTVISGTSMATPFITGLITAGATLYNKDMAVNTPYQNITAAQLINILYDSSTKGALPDNYVTEGRLVNAAAFYRAVEMCREQAKISGELCDLASNTYPFRGSGAVTPPETNPIPVPRSSGSGGGCSLTGVNGGILDILMLVLIPFIFTARHRLFR